MKTIKKFGYLIFLGIISFVIIGALISFLHFAIGTPLKILQAIFPNQNNLFLLCLTAIIIFLVGLGTNQILKKGINIGKRNLFNQTPALTEDGYLVFITGEEIAKNGITYYKVIQPIAHPLPGFLRIIVKTNLKILDISAPEAIKLVMSDGVINLADGIKFKDEVNDEMKKESSGETKEEAHHQCRCGKQRHRGSPNFSSNDWDEHEI